MIKSVCVLAILAAAVSTSAVAKDLKQDKKASAPAVSATQMTDSEMDKVTAGGEGIFSAPGNANAFGIVRDRGNSLQDRGAGQCNSPKGC
jgi:hypothetical protein